MISTIVKDRCEIQYNAGTEDYLTILKTFPIDLALEKGSLNDWITFEKIDACHSVVLDLLPDWDLKSFP